MPFVDIPEILATRTWFIEKNTLDLTHPLKESVQKLLLVSDFACRQIKPLLALLAEDSCTLLWLREQYFQAIEQLELDSSQGHFLQALRYFRHTHLLRLLLMELAGLATTEKVMYSWSDCADAIILHAIAYIKNTLTQRYGIPRDKAGKEVGLISIAMGKLGGCELNYSSDIDLIFAYSEDGKTDGQESVSNQYYFSKMIQQLIHLLQSMTPDGFVFRVDLRLRPNGDSGPLVSSWTALETYYQEQGRDWERYAMVKARVLSKQMNEVPAWFKQLITPFVYRRYVDFSVIESLRSMKAMIEREVQLHPCLNDIKRGQGGIREIEFIIQNIQLIRGGRLPIIQKSNAMEALDALKKLQLIPRSDFLRQAYLYLRKLENVVQSLNDQQTHSLPQEPVKQAQVRIAMGYDHWDELLEKLQHYQRIISFSFQSCLGKVEAFEDQERLLKNQLGNLWQGHVEETMAIHLLASLGFENPAHCYQMLYNFKHSARCRRLSQAARMRLDRFMVVLLSELINQSKTDAEIPTLETQNRQGLSARTRSQTRIKPSMALSTAVLAVEGLQTRSGRQPLLHRSWRMAGIAKTDAILLQVIHLLEHIVGRSAYLALLTENPLVLKELLLLFADSPFISNLLVHHPFLLEILLEPASDWRPANRLQLSEILQEQLSHQNEAERQEEILRQFKLINWLQAVRAEFYGLYSAVRIGKFLSDIAEVILTQILLIAGQELALRFPRIKQLKTRFAVIAYGTLGSREMNYTSDLDLVFVHTATADEEPLVTRLTQKILHMLTTRSQMGVLYAVDTRLRPSGAAGLLVSPIGAFTEYQQNEAWIWEHQALLKARIVWGNASIKQSFLNLKKSILAKPRDRLLLQQEVLNMRSKIDKHQSVEPVKQAHGGLLDLEFLVQFLLLNACTDRLAGDTHTLSQLKKLSKLDRLNSMDYKILSKAYKAYHHVLHQQVIQAYSFSLEKLQAKVADVYKLILMH